METILFYLALLTCAGFLVTTIELAWGMRQIPFLRDQIPSASDDLPRLSIIIPARNESHTIQNALQSVLSLNYPDFEIIAINDRSTDSTGELLDQLASKHANLQVIHITDLPSGWLGKTHALHVGAQQANGQFLLFTDADVVMHPDTLTQTVSYMQQQSLDHLTLSPDIQHRGLWLPLFSTYFFLYVFIYLKPWKVTDSKSKRYMGIGAFNLIRASTYQAIGGHKSIRLHPVDDLALGKHIKRSGYAQGYLMGMDRVSVVWYPSLQAMINGLMKNMFAGMRYSALFVLGGALGTLTFILWPYFALAVTHGLTFYLNLASIALMMMHFLDVMRFTDQKRWHAIFYPVISLLLTYVQIRSMILAYKQDGIVWRDTHYPLSELKRHRK